MAAVAILERRELMMQPDSIRQLPEIHSRAPWSQSLPAGPPGHFDLSTKSPPGLVKSRVVNSGAVFRVSDVITATPVCMLCRKNLEKLSQFPSFDAGRDFGHVPHDLQFRPCDPRADAEHVIGFAGLVASVPCARAADADGDPIAGKAIFQRICQNFHSNKIGVNKVGPSLWNVVGRQVPDE
jgi:hypothetical protein